MKGFRRNLMLGMGCVMVTTVACTFNPDTYEALELQRVDDLGDTVSAFPALRFAFSEPVENNEVNLRLDPDGSEYHSVLNNTKDTVSLVVTGILEGNTRYSVKLGATATTGSGSAIGPTGVSFEFFTHATEQEPNDMMDTTVRFADPICGRLYPSNDTDYFYINDPLVNGLHLNSHADGAVLGFALIDSSGQDTSVEDTKQQKYLPVPDSFTAPLFVRVFSLTAHGRYELRSYKP